MTTDKRAKREARERSERTGERYAAARRRTAHGERRFETDCCANCLEPLPDEVDVKGHDDLPSGGRETCPLTVMSSAR